jgi:hypothetical protein
VNKVPHRDDRYHADKTSYEHCCPAFDTLIFLAAMKFDHLFVRALPLGVSRVENFSALLNFQSIQLFFPCCLFFSQLCFKFIYFLLISV